MALSPELPVDRTTTNLRFFVFGYGWGFWGRAEDQGFFHVVPVGSEVCHPPQVLVEHFCVVSCTAVVAVVAIGVA